MPTKGGWGIPGWQGETCGCTMPGAANSARQGEAESKKVPAPVPATFLTCKRSRCGVAQMLAVTPWRSRSGLCTSCHQRLHTSAALVILHN